MSSFKEKKTIPLPPIVGGVALVATLITPSLKIKRNIIEDRYRDLIDDLYREGGGL